MSSGEAGLLRAHADVFACVSRYTRADLHTSLFSGKLVGRSCFSGTSCTARWRGATGSRCCWRATSGLLARIFIIQHDCGHGSFFKSKRLEHGLRPGVQSAVVHAVPSLAHEPRIHHAHVGNLDRRGIGDVPTLTVREYLARTPWRRFCYRMSREPLILFLVVPVFLLVVAHRIPDRDEWRSKAPLTSIMGTNLALAALALLLAWLIGLRAELLVELPILWASPAWPCGCSSCSTSSRHLLGAWRRLGLRHRRAARQFLLPAAEDPAMVHGQHRLAPHPPPQPRIPNYRLQECHDENPLLQDVPVMTIRDSLRTVRLALWDEAERRLISFAALKRQMRRARGDVTLGGEGCG